MPLAEKGQHHAEKKRKRNMIPLRVRYGQNQWELRLPEGQPVGAALRERGLLAQPCGAGRCGKCRILLDDAAEGTPTARPAPTEQERALLRPEDLERGVRLACCTRAVPGLSLEIPRQGRDAVLTEFAAAPWAWSPRVRMVTFAMPEPSLEDQRSDAAALLHAAGATAQDLDLAQLATLPAYRRERTLGHALVSTSSAAPVLLPLAAPASGCGCDSASHAAPDAALERTSGKAADIAADTAAHSSTDAAQGGVLLGFAPTADHRALIIDIGTTTLAALLADLNSGVILAAHGEANAQRGFGADVVTRIRHAMEHGTDSLHEAVRGQINALLARQQRQGLGDAAAGDPTLLVITGNTTMLHFFCGISAGHIGRAPFIPAFLHALQGNARRFGLESDAALCVMPGISAYIGADITASLLAAGAHTATRPFLLLDLGTNAEIVLFDGTTFHACSAAAGPCFEGAALECGMPGQDGAIDRVWHNGDAPAFSVLGGGAPLGLCGSAVLDAVALLLETGALDESGRLEAVGPLAAHIVRHNDQPAFLIAPSVLLTQKDIREVQLAKAAVRAGVETLCVLAGLEATQVDVVYLAGGFGSRLALRSALRMGLIPPLPPERVRVLGNAAACGALRYATEAGDPAAHIIRRTRHLELSGQAAFCAAYMEHMTFPEQ